MSISFAQMQINFIRLFSFGYSNVPKIKNRKMWEKIPARIWKMRVVEWKMFFEYFWTLNHCTAIDLVWLIEFYLTYSSGLQQTPFLFEGWNATAPEDTMTALTSIPRHILLKILIYRVQIFLTFLELLCEKFCRSNR